MHQAWLTCIQHRMGLLQPNRPFQPRQYKCSLQVGMLVVSVFFQSQYISYHPGDNGGWGLGISQLSQATVYFSL